MRKRLIAILLCISTILSLCTGFASAASSTIAGALGEVNITNGGYKMSYLSMNGVVRSQSYTYFNFKSASGAIKEIPAYCINPTTKGVPQSVSPGTSIKYIANEASNDPKIVGIIANGYPHRGLSELKLDNKYQAYYATKMALWCYLIDGWSIDRLKVNPSLSGVEKERGEKLLAAAKDIYKRGIWWNRVPQPTITVTADKDSAYPVTIDGKEYLQQVFTADSETWVCDYDIDIGFTMPDEVPEGTRIVDMNNNDITKIRTSPNGASYAGQFKVLYPKDSVSDQTGAVQMSLHANVYKYAIYYALCAETSKYGTLQRYMCDTDPTTEIRQSTFSRYSAAPSDTPDEPETSTETTLIIKKVETGTNMPLSGATFEVKAPDGTVLGSFVTDTSGKIIIPLTLSGQYVITEKAAPKWHLLGTETTKTVSVDYGNTATVTFENAPYGNLRVDKIDADSGASLAGATVEIKHIESGVTQTGTTDLGGSVYFDKLKPGAYQVREVSAPGGYVKDDQTYTVNVTSGTETNFVLKNQAKPGLIITKYDEQTHEVLPDVTFEVTRDTVLIGSFSTDEMGQIRLTDLQPGTYLVKEVSTSAGYVLDSTPQQIELTAGGGIKTLTFFNTVKPGIHIIKVDSRTMEPLTNVKFRISLVGGTFSKEYVTDENGEIDLTALEPGAYTVEEITAPNGYLMDDDKRIIQINAGENARFVFTNTEKPVLSVVKCDAENDSYLAGATFRIAKIEDGSHYLDRVTDTNGRIFISDLEPGVYSVKEIAAPSGYVLNDTEYHVELFPGKDSTLVVNNEKKPNLKIVKTDAVTGAPLASVTFTVNKADSSTLTTVKTDANGEALLTALDPGVYVVRETSVPDGYLLDSEPQTITLVPNKTGTVRFRNYPKPTLTIDKVDSITKDHIKGAKFHITYASNNSFTGELNDLGTYFTDENGQIKLSKLRDGWYRVTEVEPAAGYAIKDPATQDCFIQAGTGKVLTFENTPLSALIIKKVDADSGTMLQGAKFRVRYLGGTSGTGGTVIGEYTTSANGTIVITGLKAGTYVVEETKAPTGYEIDDTPQTVYLSGKEQDVVTVEFSNGKHGDLIIDKIDSVTKQPLPGAQFKITTSDGSFVGNYGGTVTSNGIYTTDSNGQIKLVNLKPDTYVVTEVKAPDGYVLDNSSQTVKVDRNDTQTLTFTNTPIGGGQIIKVDADSGKRIKGVQFEIAKMNGERIGTYTTDSNGIITLPQLADGWYTATEIKAAKGYLLDSTPHNFEVKAGRTTSLTVENTQASSMLIHKIDSVTGKGIYGVTFLVSDSKGNPIGQYTSDQNGYVYIDKTLTDGKYLVREIQAADGYVLDTTVKTFYVEYGATSTITWKNTPTMGQIQITKKSADDNPYNAFAAGTPLPGATFEVYDRAGNLVNTVVTNKNGIATTDTLPLGRYTIRETKAPVFYSATTQPIEVEIEFSGQIVRVEVLNQSVYTNVSVTKRGYKQVTPSQTIRYDFKNIANNSTVPLNSFYWRDTLPTSAVRLTKIITGTWNQRLSYKVVYKTNLHDYRTLADNLSTMKNYSLDASPAALGLASNEYVTDFMFAFGTVKAGFAQVDAPYILCWTNSWLNNGYQFANRTDVGGLHGGQWIMATDRWVTTVYKPGVTTLPKTGY